MKTIAIHFELVFLPNKTQIQNWDYCLIDEKIERESGILSLCVIHHDRRF
jgi:hypothetical protein